LRLEKGVGREKPQLLALVEWLQVEKIYDLITGATQKKWGGVEDEVEKDGQLQRFLFW